MATLKRQKADGTWEFVQVIGSDFLQRVIDIDDNVKSHLAENMHQGDNPHGIIYEEGSTSDGEYIRFGNGWQLCMVGMVLEHIGTSAYVRATWEFPKPFISPPYVFQMRDYATSLGTTITGTDLEDVGPDYRNQCTETSVNLSIRRGVNRPFTSGDAVFVNAFAIGRWK